MASKAFQNINNLEVFNYEKRPKSFRINHNLDTVDKDCFYGSITIFNESDKELIELFEINLAKCINPHGFKLVNEFEFNKKILTLTLTCSPGEAKSILLHKTNKYLEGKTAFVFKAMYQNNKTDIEEMISEKVLMAEAEASSKKKKGHHQGGLRAPSPTGKK